METRPIYIDNGSGWAVQVKKDTESIEITLRKTLEYALEADAKANAVREAMQDAQHMYEMADNDRTKAWAVFQETLARYQGIPSQITEGWRSYNPRP